MFNVSPPCSKVCQSLGQTRLGRIYWTEHLFTISFGLRYWQQRRDRTNSSHTI